MTNNRNYYITSSNHSTYGGNIHSYDFGGYTTMSDVIQDILSDWRFDEKCRRNIENRNNQNNLKKGGNN